MNGFHTLKTVFLLIFSRPRLLRSLFYFDFFKLQLVLLQLVKGHLLNRTPCCSFLSLCLSLSFPWFLFSLSIPIFLSLCLSPFFLSISFAPLFFESLLQSPHLYVSVSLSISPFLYVSSPSPTPNEMYLFLCLLPSISDFSIAFFCEEDACLEMQMSLFAHI